MSLDGSSADVPVEETPESNNKSGNNKSGGSTAVTGNYESPTFGYVLNFDDTTWTELDRDTTDNGVDQFTLSGPDNITVLVQGMEAGQNASAQGCVDSYAGVFQENVADDLAPVTDKNDDPVVGEDKFGTYALYSYTDKNGDTQVLYLECGASPDEATYVLFVALAPVDSLESMLTEIATLMGGLEF